MEQRSRGLSRRVSRGFSRERFQAAIEQAGVSQSDIARLADVSAATIRSWVRRGGAPDIERLTRIAKVLELDVAAFVEVPDDEAMPSDLRIRCGLTQVQLGALAGLSTTVISGFERAETRWSDRKAEKIAPVLGVNIEQLREAWQRARERPAGAAP
ncbi:helix-turn-helix transcriptional regulator [[Mycobacterium] nativiensis]|uniref:Helix-turn-helix transcriptional regulator n=1 Tax=[Mycobacterium] nativiensis TaxID=2855503 RepID=A0ABU5XZM4_9MYCO|nr:helix-turn-helix transcriptional regulator [Mycolicibacter sp. MYC340]MEB3033328.1 helix-turn-helix transcriptional regulator [Mycolicibacter sp. MYC340]